MKNTFFKSLLVILLIFNFNCEKDETIENQKSLTQEQNVSLRHINKKDLDKNILSKINTEITQLKTGLFQTNDQGRFEYNESLGFYIDLDNGKLITDQQGNLYYTYPMFRENEEKLENVIFMQSNGEGLKTYIAKYDLTSAEFKELSYEEQKEQVPSFQKLEDGLPGYICVDIYQIIDEGHDCPYPGGVNPNGLVCEHEESIVVYTFCAFEDTGGGGSSDTSNTNTGNGEDTGVTTGATGPGGGPNNSNDTNDNNDVIITSPVPTSDWDAVIRCINSPSELGGDDNTTISIETIENAGLTREQWAELNDYLQEIGCSEHAQELVILAMEDLASYDETNYPGMENSFPFNWWNDDDFVSNNISLNVDGANEELTSEEKWLVALFPAQALIINANRDPAQAETVNRFGFNGRNDRSDAFRHAFFNAMNSNDAGDRVARLFSNAHESEVPANLILEAQMDIFNNNVGHIIGDEESFFTSDQNLSNLVWQSLIDGNLVYLSPLGTIVPPNFGINSSTQLIPTDQ